MSSNHKGSFETSREWIQINFSICDEMKAHPLYILSTTMIERSLKKAIMIDEPRLCGACNNLITKIGIKYSIRNFSDSNLKLIVFISSRYMLARTSFTFPQPQLILTVCQQDLGTTNKKNVQKCD